MRNTPEQLADRIRGILAGRVPRGVNPAEVAAEYAAHCRRAEQLVGECCRLHRGGQSAEVVRTVRESRVFELLAALEFPDSERWRERCAQNGWEVPAPFSERDVNDLNEGYAQGTDLAGLLERRAIATHDPDHKAAVTWLRKLREKQPGNPDWESELRQAEARRLEELAVAIAQAIAAQDRPRLETLRQELGADWLCRGPAATLRANLGIVVFRYAAEELAEALGAAREEAVRAALARVDEQRAVGAFAVPDELVRQIDMARAWVDERDREQRSAREHRELVAHLYDSVRSDRQNPGLAGLWQQLLTMEREVPPDLSPMVSGALAEQEEHRQAAARRRLLTQLAAGIVVLVGVTAAALAYVTWSGATRWEFTLGQVLERRQVKEARQLLDELTSTHPYLATWIDVRGLEERTTGLAQQIEANRERVALATDRLQRAREAGWSAADDELTGLFDDLDRALTAGTLDVDPQYRDQRDALHSEWETLRVQRQAELDKAFLDRVLQLQGSVGALSAALKTLDPDELKATLADVSRLQDEADGILKAGDRASAHVKAPLEEVSGTLRTARESAESRYRQLLALRDAPTLERYFQAAAECADTCGDETFAKTLGRLAALADHAVAITAYPGTREVAALTEAQLKQSSAGIAESNIYWYRLLADGMGSLRSHDENSAAVKTALGDYRENALFVRAWQAVFAPADPDDSRKWKSPRLGVLKTPPLVAWANRKEHLYYGMALDELCSAYAAKIARESRPAGEATTPLGLKDAKIAAYAPAPDDTEPAFEELNLIYLGNRIPKLLPHCVFMRAFLGEYEALADADLVRFLLRQTGHLHSEWARLRSATAADTALEPQVVLTLMTDFIGYAERLAGRWCLPARLRDFQDEARKLDLKGSWLCSASASYRAERNAVEHLLEKFSFTAADVEQEYALRLAAADACLHLGVQWAGRTALLPRENAWVLRAPTPPAELWVLRETRDRSRLALRLAVSRGADGTLKPAMPVDAFRPGEPLFSAGATKTAEEVLAAVARLRGVDSERLRDVLQREEYGCWPARQRTTGGD
jgi:hypothetical protein